MLIESVSHQYLIGNHYHLPIAYLLITICLAFIFIILQAYEYWSSAYDITDSVYGSVFYLATGLHGLHIIVGTIALALLVIRLLIYHDTSSHHIGTNSSILYWHFIDILWIFIYGILYLLSSYLDLSSSS